MKEQTAVDKAPRNLWAVVLAGEDGSGLRSHFFGPDDDGNGHEDYRAPFGSESLLRQTLNRTRLAIPLERTVVVANRRQESYLAEEFPVAGAPRLIIQPRDRGTAPAVLLPIHWIRHQEPKAAVAIFPSEQTVLEPFAFMQHVVKIAHFVERHDREIVMVGARPTYPEVHYGWIETGERIPDSGPELVWQVSSLRESLSYSIVRAFYESGCLWNTSVIVARAEALLQASRRRSPKLDARLETVAALVGTPHERKALEELFSVAPDASFFETILAGAPLSASRLPPIHWSGQASPDRVRDNLNRADDSAAWRMSSDRWNLTTPHADRSTS
jgi:mannose-1-phosphate guanylyltransferase